MIPDTLWLGLPAFQSQHIALSPDRITIRLAVTSSGAACPQCNQVSTRVHSRYHRTLADLPWHGVPVVLDVEARKYFCDRSDCPQRIFVQRLDAVARVYGRQTLRLGEAHRSIGFAVGGEAGGRLATHLGMPINGDTLLRRIRQTPLPEPVDPQVVGIDDWAFRRGYRYGTIVCDLEAHRPIALLVDRNPKHVADWFKAHPTLRIISRDRGSEYAHAAQEGAPQAVQVADRWHLVHNLRDSLERMLDRHAREVRQAAVFLAPSAKPTPEVSPSTVTVVNTPIVSAALKPPKQDPRQERYEKVLDLHRQGKSFRAIARQLGLDRQTVSKYVRAGTFPKRAAQIYRRRTEAFTEVLRQRWNEGCHNAVQLFHVLQTLGFTGSYYAVRRRVASWRREPSGHAPPIDSRTVQAPSSRRIATWLVMDPQNRTPEDNQFLETLKIHCSEVATVAPLAEAFTDLIRHRNAPLLDSWLAQTQKNNMPSELKDFTQGLTGDPAVSAALVWEWSNGQVEGQINKLKLIKRQMYGRAGFDLLRQRVLYRE